MGINGTPAGAAASCLFHVCTSVDLDHGAPYTSSCALRQALLRVVPSSTLPTAGPFGPARAEALSARALKSGPPSWSVRSGPVCRRPVKTAARSGTGPARTVSTLSLHPQRLPHHVRRRLLQRGRALHRARAHAHWPQEEADTLQTAEGWSQFTGGFFFGGVSGAIWAYFLLYVLDLPYFFK